MADVTARGATDIARHLHSQTDPRAHERAGPFVISRGEGVYIYDEEGRQYLEGMSGLWCVALGFSEERLIAAANAAFATLPCYHTFNHRSNEYCIALSEELGAIAPFNNPKVYFTSSGSEANDTAVKAVRYYFNALGKPEKQKIISRRNGFHGSTVMAARLSGLPHMHRAFGLPDMGVRYADCPHPYRFAEPGETDVAFAERLAASLDALILEEGPDTIAAFIAEPVMGAGGVVVPPDGYFPKIHAVLKKHDILFIADEIVCGLGRMGAWFGSEYFGVVPDVVSMAKALSSGYVPVGAVLISDPIYQAIADQSHQLGTFGHGFTYSGHPVASAVAVEAVRIYREIDAPARIRRLAPALAKALAPLGNHALVGDVRHVGLIGAVELVADKHSKAPFPAELSVAARVEKACRDQGLIIRLLGDTIAVCPPFIIEEDEIALIGDRLARALDGVEHTIRPGLT